MKPKFFFDYIFYRVTAIYLNWKNGGGGVDTGVISVTWIQFFTLGSALGVISRIVYDRTETAPYAKTISAIAVGLFTVFYIWNTLRYKKERYETLKEYWKDESLSNRKLKGLLVVLSIILPMVPMILVGVFW